MNEIQTNELVIRNQGTNWLSIRNDVCMGDVNASVNVSLAANCVH